MTEKYPLKRESIRIRDPFILTDADTGCYYMYGTTDLRQGSIYTGNTFSVYKSRDLKSFSLPKVVVSPPEGFWGERDFWAPEVHKWRGKYYLFGSCIGDGYHRGTHIFVCDTPDGTFVPVAAEPATPKEWECLDGTFYVEDGVPYMVFCHEWVQVGDGEIWAVPLLDDLSAPAGEPFFLFRATDESAVSAVKSENGAYITDGPFLYKENGKLRLIWSSFCGKRYMVLEAESDSIHGKWTHLGSRFDFDGGHAMLFRRLDGVRMISLHSPNTKDMERPLFLEY